MRFFHSIVILILFSGLPLTANALDVNEFILENGLKVLILEDHKAPTATFQVWYRVGSRDEDIGRTGLSHLLEHMMFKGTEKHGPKTFSQTIKRSGGIDNAFTSREYTGYFELLASDRIDIPVALEADRMRNLILTEESVLSERDVVKEERRLRYEDDPQSLVFEGVIAAAFMNHPYRWPVIGWMSDLEQLKTEDLVKHYNMFYAPNNAVIIVVGDVDGQAMLARIQETFGKIPKGPQVRRNIIAEPEQRGEKRIYIRKEAELPYMVSAYKVPNIHHDDSFALEVLGSILSEGRSSRLYQRLVYEKQIAVSAWASYFNFFQDPFLFFIGATAASGRDIGEVERAIAEVLEEIKNSPPTDYEVQKAKNQIEASFVMEQDSFYMLARTIGSFEMIGGWRMIDTYLDGIRLVSAQDVSRVARKYLVAESKTTGVLVPVGEASP